MEEFKPEGGGGRLNGVKVNLDRVFQGSENKRSRRHSHTLMLLGSFFLRRSVFVRGQNLVLSKPSAISPASYLTLTHSLSKSCKSLGKSFY